MKPAHSQRRPRMPMAARLILWHRRSGLLLLPVIVMLAVTGVLINHSQTLGWYETPVYSRWIGALYGIPAVTVEQGFNTGEHWVSQAGEQLYIDQQPVAHCAQPLLGAVMWQQNLVWLCDQRAELRTPSGELIEPLPELPAQGQTLALDAGQLYFIDPDHHAYQLDETSWSWVASDTVGLLPATSSPLPDALLAVLNHEQPLPGISRERFLLDLHSGRLFGDIGVLVVDLASLVLIFLAASGAWSWLRRLSRRRH